MHRFPIRPFGMSCLLFGVATAAVHAQGRAALVRDADRPTAQPVHAACSTPGSALRFKCSLFTVPAGKRLVVDTVTYSVSTLSYQEPEYIVVFRDDAPAQPLGVGKGDNFLLLSPVLASSPGNKVYQATQAVTMYLDENETLAGASTPGSSFPMSYTFAFQGHLVDK